MRWALFFALLGLACAVAHSADLPKNSLLPCPEGASKAACNPSKQDLKTAREAFKKGLTLESADPDGALQEYSRAAELVPRNVDYLTAREMARQQAISRHIQQGGEALDSGKQVEAIADFRAALHLDPDNPFARQRLTDAVGDSAPVSTPAVTVVDQSPEIHVNPGTNLASFHFRGDSRELLSVIARAYGISAQVDDSVKSQRVAFNIDNVEFFRAMAIAGQMTKSFWSPIDAKQIVINADTPENHRQYDRMAMKTFYVPGATTPAALNDVMNLLRNLFEIKFITPNQAASTLAVRAPQDMLDAATQFMQSLDSTRPQIMLDVKVYQVSHTLMRNMGVHLPNQFNLFNIPAGALAALGGQNIQDLINQLISSGGINQANNTAISALLAQLQNQQNSIFSQPVATFGGGKTLTGISFDQLSVQLSLNEGWVQQLDHATLRAGQNTDATFRLGSRFPILNASFAPIFNTAAISQVLRNNSFQAAFPSFNYEDLGLTVKAKPAITSSSDVALQLELSLKALTGQSFNGVPVIGNRDYKGSITLADGEPAVIAGQVTHSETMALSGIPGLGQVPGLNKITATNSKQIEDDELLLVITPHITTRGTGVASEIYLPR